MILDRYSCAPPECWPSQSDCSTTNNNFMCLRWWGHLICINITKTSLNRREEYTVAIGLFVLEVLRLHQLTLNSQNKMTQWSMLPLTQTYFCHLRCRECVYLALSCTQSLVLFALHCSMYALALSSLNSQERMKKRAIEAT